MNKNIAIGLLAIIIIFGGGYLLLRNNPDAITPTPTTNTVNNTDTKQPVSTEPVTTTPALTLGAPKVQTSQSVGTSISTALVTGTVKPNGVSTTYWFEYGKTNALGSRTSAQQIGSGFYDIYAPAYMNSLSADTVYYFRLMANNNFGATYGETYTFKTNNNPAPKVSLPTVNSSNATNIQRTSAVMNGNVNPNGWQTNYWFEYGKDSNFGNTTSIKSIDVSTLTSSVSDSLPSLEPLTKYYFRLNAQNQFGTINSKTLSFTTSGPANPGVPNTTSNQPSKITTSSAQLNGSINPNGADTTYWFEYSTDSLLGSIVGNTTPTKSLNASTNTTNVSADLIGLTKNTKYFYHLIAKNQFGTVDGKILSFTTKSR